MEQSTSKNHQEQLCFVLIGNIPAQYHSSDLRSFFSHFIETEGFECFHFRHRPEGQNTSEQNVSKNVPASSAQQQHTTASPSKNAALPKPLNKTCCIVKMKELKFRELLQLYHKKQWLDSKGNTLPSRCFISKINTDNDEDNIIAQHNPQNSASPIEGTVQNNISNSGHELKADQSQEKTLTNTDSGGHKLSQQDLNSLKELRPPMFMPNGNVGTPTKVFLDLIKACKLPPKIIGKLGLTFPKSHKNRIYGNVKFDYIDKHKPVSSSRSKASAGKLTGSLSQHGSGTSSSATSGKKGKGLGAGLGNTGMRKQQTPDHRKSPSPERTEEKVSESEEDVDYCEEWERHEALHDDPANYERNKERVYEEKLEVVWEKGGPGLVWYTDEKYWREQEGDFDEQTADDWDVDMSIYYDPLTGGDMDSRQLVTMRKERRRRQGLYSEGDNLFGDGKIGQFEKHTKGIGRKVMEQQGWSEGSGLGPSNKGMAEALDNEGQAPRDKTGFGYYGEKINRYGASGSSRKRRDPDDFMISTVYDKGEDMEIPEKLLRRTDHNTMKYRPKKTDK